MNHELSLTLELLEQAPDCLRFRLAIRNRSEAKVLVPSPKIHGLRFANTATMQESQWYTSYLVAGAAWDGFTLAPALEKVIEYSVHPCGAGRKDDHFEGWSVDLPPGDYLAWFQFEVGEDYSCPDSHYRYIDILREAESAQAVVWMGRLTSNRLPLSHPLPPHSAALERVLLIETCTPVPQWSRDEFLRAASAGMQRREKIEDLFGIRFGLFQDALSQIAPSFQLTTEEQKIAETVCVWRSGYACARLAVLFLKWELCPDTSGLPNPYEPWVEIWEHGGYFKVEPGRFVDVFDNEFVPVGSVMVRHR